jgi:DNA-binding transcriptional LysR family regulator
MLSAINRLRALSAVAELASFSAAAEKLGYTQSAVSQQIVALEQEVGLTLVERTRPPTLTQAGRVLLEHAGAVFEHLATADAKLDALRGLRAGRVRLAAFSSAHSTFVASAVAAFTNRWPDIEVHIDVAEPPNSVSMLKRGDLDLAVVFDWSNLPERPDPALERRHLLDDDLKVILPTNHRLARRGAVRLIDLAGEEWIAPDPRGPASVYWRMLDELANSAGFTPRVAHHLDDLSATHAYVAAGLGVALMNDLTLPAPRSDIVVRPLADVPVTRRIWTATVKGRQWPPASALSESLRDSLVR